MSDDIRATTTADSRPTGQHGSAGILGRLARSFSALTSRLRGAASDVRPARSARIPFSLISAPQFVVNGKK